MACLEKLRSSQWWNSKQNVISSIRTRTTYYGLKALRRNLWCVASHVLKTDVSLPNLGLNHGFLTDFGFLLKRVS